MIKNKLLLGILLVVLFFVSINYSHALRSHILIYAHSIKKSILTQKDYIASYINTFFNQQKKILVLEKQLQSCQKTSMLSIAFATKLNNFLKQHHLETYDPSLELVRTISYVKLGDFTSMWIDFPSYQPTRIYGVIYKGYAAGIVDNEYNQPMVRLLHNTDMQFSVAIGKEKHLGIIFGHTPNLQIKYIPTYATIKVGDEVITSGNDNIFFEGIKVGKVFKIQSNNLYKMAIVKPYIDIQKPDFLYVVDVNKKFIKEINVTKISEALK